MPSHDETGAASPRRDGMGSGLVHASLVAGVSLALFVWLFGAAVFGDGYLAESDLYEYFLPIFVSPLTIWSDFEFAGFPAFADPQDSAWYPLHLLFARVLHSWSGFVISAYVLASGFTYAYVYNLTRSVAASVVAALAFGLSEATMDRTAHLAFLHATAWLPAILLAIDRLQPGQDRRWTVVGALAVGCCILAGHPQAIVYTLYWAGLYAAVRGVVERRQWSYVRAAASMFALGTLLASVKVAPLIEASEEVAREVVNFGQFVGHANTPGQMLALALPRVPHDGREAPLYVGLATLLLALIAVPELRRRWRAGFWVCAVTVGLLLGMGGQTPLARVAYAIPLYDKFRVVSRHLFLASFGAAVLSAYGFVALRDGRVSTRRGATALATVAAVIGLGLWLIARGTIEAGGVRWSPGPGRIPTEIWYQCGVFVATASVVVIAVLRPLGRWPVALVTVLAVDLVNSQPFQITALGLSRTLVSPRELQPSVHAARLARQLDVTEQRLLTLGGSATDALVPGSLARLWRFPAAGGYGPMLLRRHSSLAEMGNNGSVRPYIVGANDAALDVLAVKYLVVRPTDIASQGEFKRAGRTWERAAFGLRVGRPDCSDPHPATLTLWPRTNAPLSEIAIVGHLRCADHVAQGRQVATVTVQADDRSRVTVPLRAGIEIAEFGLGDPAVRKRTPHAPATVFESYGGGTQFDYLIKVSLPRPVTAQSIEITKAQGVGWLMLDRVTAVDTAGRSIPQVYPEMMLGDETRWREVARFRTSRQTDRDRDDDNPGEVEYVVYENLRAMPRAWIVRQLSVGSAYDAVQTMRTSRLPDGRRFDPREVAVVEQEGAPPQTVFPDGARLARVQGIQDGRVSVAAFSERGGFLVLSDTWYPGWRAYIDGGRVPVYRVNVSLRAIVLPPGHHTVVFRFVPISLYFGAAISLLALLALVVVWRPVAVLRAVLPLVRRRR